MAILAFLLIGEKCLNLTAKDNTMGNMKYKFKNLQTAFGSLVQEISEEGSLVNSRGSKQKELIFQHMEIEDPTDILIGLPSRPTMLLLNGCGTFPADPLLKISVN